jgi:hypothetical protein
VKVIIIYYSADVVQVNSKERMNTNKVAADSPQQGLNDLQRDLISSKICDLALKIPGSRLELYVQQLYQELEKARIKFKPKTYLSDEWGCPEGVPVIGIPFYLADPALFQLECQFGGIEPENEAETMMFLRHEAGHAFNYAYLLYRKAEWRKIFGKFSKPYIEEYKPIPFSARFVHNVPGWYAQKHPDDDFAETFAVWLTPGSDWVKKYEATPALVKLLYIENVVAQYGRRAPTIIDEQLDKPVEELKMTLGEWYASNRQMGHRSLNLHPIIDQDLKKLFPDNEGQMVADVLQSHQVKLVREVNCWTGIDRHILDSLFNEITEKTRMLKLKVSTDQCANQMQAASVFLTTLAMNYQRSGQFIES